VRSGEATNTNIMFGATRPWLESTIYRTRGEHTNHYTTDAVLNGGLLSLFIKNVHNFKYFTYNIIYIYVLRYTSDVFF
jgi:hypothetical protein